MTANAWRIGSIAALLALAVALTVACAPEESPEPAPPAAPGQSETPTGGPLPPTEGEIAFEEVVGGFDEPLYVTHAGDGSERLFVLEKTGRAWVVADGQRQGVFLDLSEVVSTESEQGLLGIAFSPAHADDGQVFVSYTDRRGTSVLSRFSADADAVDPASEQVLLTVEQPFKNHNGGMVEFGPDGYLYFGLGDGGSGGDPQGNGQDPGTLLGKMLRIDVLQTGSERSNAYAIPEDNPFPMKRGTRPEIWATGLRNPWRFSFDRTTGDLWIGDVGQSAWEEIDFQPAGSAGGENYGWNVYEGTHPYPPDAVPPTGPFTPPVFEYDREAGKSVTGGYVYRGEALPWLEGVYVYGDFVDGRIWGLTRAADGSVTNELLAQTDFAISSFGEDEAGELYVVDFRGTVHKIVAE